MPDQKATWFLGLIFAAPSRFNPVKTHAMSLMQVLPQIAAINLAQRSKSTCGRVSLLLLRFQRYESCNAKPLH
jgi:hypothetical protein